MCQTQKFCQDVLGTISAPMIGVIKLLHISVVLGFHLLTVFGKAYNNKSMVQVVFVPVSKIYQKVTFREL